MKEKPRKPGRPKMEEGKKKKFKSISIPEELYLAYEAEAERTGTTVGKLGTECLIESGHFLSEDLIRRLNGDEVQEWEFDS